MRSALALSSLTLQFLLVISGPEFRRGGGDQLCVVDSGNTQSFSSGTRCSSRMEILVLEDRGGGSGLDKKYGVECTDHQGRLFPSNGDRMVCLLNVILDDHAKTFR